jgi:hypothetical protein
LRSAFNEQIPCQNLDNYFKKKGEGLSPSPKNKVKIINLEVIQALFVLLYLLVQALK